MNDKNKSTIPEIEALSDDALADVAGGYKHCIMPPFFQEGDMVRLASGGNFQCHNCATASGSGNQKTGIVYRSSLYSDTFWRYRLQCPVCKSCDILDENGKYEIYERDLTNA